MTNFFEKYQGYILAGVAQLGPIDDWADETP